MKKKLLITGLVSLGLVVGANASENRDTTINVYGVGAKVAPNSDNTNGAGLMLDSEDFKFKVEGTSDFIKTGAVLKVNPLDENLYFKFGLNYLNQKIYSPSNTSARVNQYSSALATGYMIQDDFYIEIGGSHTNLNGTLFGDYQMLDEKTSLAYVEMAKRWESGLGTIDTTANAGRVFHEYSDNENSFGAGIDYYPMDNAKLAYSYQYEKDNIVNNYKAQYSYVFVEFNDNISNDTYNVKAGFAIAFDDIFDISTYKAPTNIKSHLSELHRFENAVLNDNMQLQTTAGVTKTQAAIDRDNTPAISTPTISLADQTVNDNGGGLATDLPAPTVSGVNAGAVYSITTGVAGLTINASTGVMTYDKNLDSNTNESHSITIKVTNTDGGTSSTTFTLNIVDNL
nr:cadherin repeat domain-containing protein [uncultured Sulfurimonas sp.]